MRCGTIGLCAEMSARMKNYLPVLKRIRKLGEKAKQQYVRKCDKEFLDCASEEHYKRQRAADE